MKIADRVQETTNTTGTGTITLAGASTGYRLFSSAFVTGDLVPYVITDGTLWETGIGTLTTGTPWTLARTTITASSSGGSAISVTAGSLVFCDITAGYAANVGGKQVQACAHTTTSAITIAAKMIECTTDGDGDTDYLALPAGFDGQELEVYVKSCGSVADSLTINATFADGTTTYSFGPNPKGRGINLVYTTTATAGWICTAVNSVVNDRSTNASTATQSPGTARAYVTGSSLKAPITGFKIGTILRWTLSMTKTAAGTAASTIDICFGTTATTTDTARVTFTSPSQTGVVDTMEMVITAVIRGPITASCIVGGTFHANRTGAAAAGFSYVSNAYVASSAFDITTAAIGAGLCVTGGASSVWTINNIMAEYITT